MQSLQAAASTVVSPTTAAANNAAMTAAAATPSRSTRSKAAAPPAAVSEDVADADEDASGKGGIQIVQEVVQDETTGMTIEETKITLTGDEAKAVMGDSSEGLIGTEEQAREAAENALKLIESLKEQGTLQSSTSKRAREDDAAAAAAALEEDADEDEAENVDGDSKPGVFKRLFGRRQQKPLTKRRRQPRQTIGDLQVMQSPDGAQVLVAQTAAPPQPEANRRRYIAMAGMVVMGAATYVYCLVQASGLPICVPSDRQTDVKRSRTFVILQGRCTVLLRIKTIFSSLASGRTRRTPLNSLGSIPSLRLLPVNRPIEGHPHYCRHLSDMSLPSQRYRSPPYSPTTSG